ncbi:hypothetical protein PN498_25025 [Oscillatoria sp. CS-180]|uniref:hypothetical protein n=1 Tax=Oscillatoria sp. CS-180 TaxID=3021720 RepID=UPI00232A96EC|nr:hypothetical protein [Oscillatoria sp. CS-180]MDB9529280.1 hypothetical protein [Oscillatoria sp. CS-180]
MLIKRVFWIGLLVLFCWLCTIAVSTAQTNSIRLESRIDQLESELSRVRSQITRLESQINNPGRPVAPVESTALPNELSLEEQFDNLATLAIELKLDVRELQERVSQLEPSE